MIKRRILYALCVLITMGAIFCFSTQSGVDSNKVSDVIVNPITNETKAKSDKEFDTETEQKKYWDNIKGKIQVAVRKCAHAFNFALLAFFVYMFLRSCNLNTTDALIITLVFCACYAGTDELHQKFVDGRTPRFTDVCIDLFGGVVSMTIVWLAGKINRLTAGRR